MIEIIKPTLGDLDKIVQVEQSAWPDIGDGMVAEYEKFQKRIELGCMWLLMLDDKPAGIISYQKPSFASADSMQKLWDVYQSHGGLMPWNEIVKGHGLPKDWYAATLDGHISKDGESTHDPNSDCVFLIGVGVDSKLKGKGLVNYLIAHTLKEAQKEGTKFVLGYGRLPQLHEAHDTEPTTADAEEHLLIRKPGTILPADYGARFHVRNGAIEVAVIPKAMDDPESWDYGFLALYKL